MWRCMSRRLLPPLTSDQRAALSFTVASLRDSQQVAFTASHTYSHFEKGFCAEVQPPEKKLVVNPSEELPEVQVVVSDEPDHEFGIATGLELQELLAEKEGKRLFDLDAPRGPFGTKEHPSVIQSRYDERIVGRAGGEGEDEHDVVWFKLKKGKMYECAVCSQVFELAVVGPGGPPGGHHHH